MRSRERLIEVLEQVNAHVVGRDVDLAFAHAALSLRRKTEFAPIFMAKIEEIARRHSSPHVRELAKEALVIDGEKRSFAERARRDAL